MPNHNKGRAATVFIAAALLSAALAAGSWQSVAKPAGIEMPANLHPEGPVAVTSIGQALVHPG